MLTPLWAQTDIHYFLSPVPHKLISLNKIHKQDPSISLGWPHHGSPAAAAELHATMAASSSRSSFVRGVPSRSPGAVQGFRGDESEGKGSLLTVGQASASAHELTKSLSGPGAP